MRLNILLESTTDNRVIYRNYFKIFRVYFEQTDHIRANTEMLLTLISSVMFDIFEEI
jgi:hypothetical protein